jgi:sialate O-acetylesterase
MKKFYSIGYLGRALLLPGLIFITAISAMAQLAVSPIFGSNMVLQRGTTVPVFGTASPGATVVVQFQSQSKSAVADAAGKWRVDLSSMTASSVPGTMTITSGSNTATFTGIQVGEVWLCSGQSNMGWSLSNADEGAAAIADAANHNIRIFRMTAGSGPATTTWKISNSTTISNFSAVGYWMGLELSQWFGNVPIGLIQATHDGTSIDHWQHSSSGIGDDYDAMVKAIQPFAIKGVAWYQGESNGGDAAYASKLTNMINEWRADWALPNLPFGIIQLAYRSGWNVCRNAQLEVADTSPNCYLVVIRDLPGGALHPTTKKPVGLRTAIGARGLVYGDAINYSGAIRDIPNSYASGIKVILNWKFIGNGLFTSDNAAPGTFSVAGTSGQFKTATAVIVGNTVEVWNSGVSAPRRVQYSYSSVGNLYSRVSIPVQGGTATVDRLKVSEFQITVGTGSGAASARVATTDATEEFVEQPGKRDLSIFPNPSNGNFSIDLGRQPANKIQITVTDMQGNIVYQKLANEGDVIDVNSNVKPGTYILQIVDDKKEITKRRVIIR